MTISPNVEELTTNIPLQDSDSNFKELAEAIKNSTDIKNTYKVVDEIGLLVDGIVDQINAKQPDPDKKIVATLLPVSDALPVSGGPVVVSHKFIFKHQIATGKPAFLEVQRLSGNTLCASCEAQPADVTVPHNVVTAAHAKDAIQAALRHPSLNLLDTGAKLYNHMIGVAESTKGKGSLATQGKYQRQCTTCEGCAPGDPAGKFLAGKSLMQRAAGATAPGGATAASRGMDKQFQTTTPKTREDITDKRIKGFISRLADDIASGVYANQPPSTSIIDVLCTDDVKRGVFLTQLWIELKNGVKI
jgi:hypothetical protein